MSPLGSLHTSPLKIKMFQTKKYIKASLSSFFNAFSILVGEQDNGKVHAAFGWWNGVNKTPLLSFVLIVNAFARDSEYRIAYRFCVSFEKWVLYAFCCFVWTIQKFQRE